MPKARKRKIPITGTVLRSESTSSRPEASRTVIRRFHVLLKEQAKLKRAKDLDVEKLARIEADIAELGGLEEYQRMSAIGQGKDRGGGSEKVFVAWMKGLGRHQRTQGKIRLLEVGALKPDNYAACSHWIDNTPMDLHSRHSQILEQNFLEMDEEKNFEQWDAISLSLVLNFVPEAQDRGKMLRMAYKMIASDGCLFLALPLPCIMNSRYLTADHLKDIMVAIGFVEAQFRWRQGGKMAYWLYTKGTPAPSVPPSLSKKTVLRTGNRNNFSILL